MEKLLLERVYIAIIKSGEVLYASTALDKHIEFLKLFAITEFKDLKIFDHHFPLSGTNLAIFKLTDDLLIALYKKKGYQGQLLSFKTKINKYLADIGGLARAPHQKTMETESKGQIFPVLVETVSLTIGLTEDESEVLKLCNGNHSIKEIIDKTRIPRKKVVDIIRHFEDKGWLKLSVKGEVEMIPVSIKKFPETAVRLGMISKKSYDVNELCDGNHTCKDIAEQLIMSEKELKNILEKMEKNKIIKMTIQIPERETGGAIEEGLVYEESEMKYPELLVKPTLGANISFSLGFDEDERRVLTLLDGNHSIIDIHDATQIPYLEILLILIKYEEKGWVRIPIDDFMHIVAIKDKLKSDAQIEALTSKYQDFMQERVTVVPEQASPAIPERPEGLTPEEEAIVRQSMIQKIRAELPLMPLEAQNKMVERLIKVSEHSRDAILNKLINSPTSIKFKKREEPIVSVPPPVPAPVPAPIYPAPPPPVIIPEQPVIPAEPPKPVIDETPLLRPSELLTEKPSLKSLSSELSEQLLPQKPPEPLLGSTVPEIPKAPEAVMPQVEEIVQAPQPTSFSAVELLSKQISAGQDQVNEVLSFIDSLLGIPEVLYLALVDFNGTIFYQTTKEEPMWDITKDIMKLVQNWQGQAPSIFLADIKYATIKASDMLIATNIKGMGHIIAIPINDNLFILTKVNKEGDALLISDDIAIVSKQIKEMF